MEFLTLTVRRACRHSTLHVKSLSFTTIITISNYLPIICISGLCHNNVNGSPEEKFHTTNGDLQGFWDMVYLQVEHVDSLYKEIQDLKANNWVVSTFVFTWYFLLLNKNLSSSSQTKWNHRNSVWVPRLRSHPYWRHLTPSLLQSHRRLLS